jgi:hypothetical protein
MVDFSWRSEDRRGLLWGDLGALSRVQWIERELVPVLHCRLAVAERLAKVARR